MFYKGNNREILHYREDTGEWVTTSYNDWNHFKNHIKSWKRDLIELPTEEELEKELMMLELTS